MQDVNQNFTRWPLVYQLSPTQPYLVMDEKLLWWLVLPNGEKERCTDSAAMIYLREIGKVLIQQRIQKSN